MLDVADGNTIEDFHDAAATAFAGLATGFQWAPGSSAIGMVTPIQFGEEIVESSPTSNGGDAGEEVSQPET